MQAQTDSFLSPEVLVAALVGFVIGAVIFWLLGRNKSPEISENPLQKPYDELQAEFQAYRSKVNAHFSKTATAVDNLTKSYQEVFEHLSEGAQSLMEGEALKIERDKRQGKAVTLAYLSNIEARQASVPTPTKDTPKPEAPKSETDKSDSRAEASQVRAAPRPAEATKPAAEPKAEAKAATAPQEKAVAENKAAASTKAVENNAAASKEKTEANAETALQEAKAADNKTAAQKAAENAGLTSTSAEKDPLSSVKRHVRDNQEK